MADTKSYYDSLRASLEKQKFDSTIQLANSQAQANQSLNRSLNASGYGSQGYGATQQAATNNAYINANNQNNSDYWDKLVELNSQENTALASDATDNYNSFINALDDDANLDDIYSTGATYGLYTKNSDGTYSLNTNSDLYNNLTTTQKNELNNLVNNTANYKSYGNATALLKDYSYKTAKQGGIINQFVGASKVTDSNLNVKYPNATRGDVVEYEGKFYAYIGANQWSDDGSIAGAPNGVKWVEVEKK